MRGDLNATTYSILDECVFPTFWQYFGEGPCPDPNAQSEVHKDMFFTSLMWKNSTGLHRAFGMNWEQCWGTLYCLISMLDSTNQTKSGSEESSHHVWATLTFGNVMYN